MLQKTIKRNTERKDLDIIAGSVVATIKAAGSLPGRVDLKRELPSARQPYSIKISGSYENFQAICILAKGTTENVRRIMFIKRRVNGGNFSIERENPSEIQIRKSGQISLVVM